MGEEGSGSIVLLKEVIFFRIMVISVQTSVSPTLQVFNRTRQEVRV